MTLSLDTARTIGQLAIDIQARVDMLAMIDQAISEQWQVTNYIAKDTLGQQHSLVLGPIDADTSAQSLQFTKAVYQAQLDALNAQLAAIA